jgi:ferritin-like metal-binding protein YciE
MRLVLLLGAGVALGWWAGRKGLGFDVATTPARKIDSMEALYNTEMQELHSAESEFCWLLQELPPTLPNAVLERYLRGYATEVRTRQEDLERMLSRHGVNPREHPDQAMHALIVETRKMGQMCATNLRAAALVASLQRLLHHKIAGYGTVATYAQTIGRMDEASRLAEYSDRDKAVDRELTSIARELLNPVARVEPGAGVGGPDVGGAAPSPVH